ATSTREPVPEKMPPTMGPMTARARTGAPPEGPDPSARRARRAMMAPHAGHRGSGRPPAASRPLEERIYMVHNPESGAGQSVGTASPTSGPGRVAEGISVRPDVFRVPASH